MTREAQLTNLKQRLRESESKNVSLTGKLKDLHESITKHKESFTEMNKEYNKRDIEMNRYKSINEQLQKQVSAMKKSKDDTTVFNRQKVQELEITRAELNRLKTRNEHLQEDHDALKRSKEIVNSELAGMKAMNSSLKQDLEMLKQQDESNITRETKYKNQIDAMKAEVERYKLVRDDAHTHMSTLRESSEATTSLVDSLQSQLNEARAKIERYEAISVTSPPATWSPKQSVSPTSSEELPSFAQIGFDKNANDISTLQMEEPDLVVTVEVGDGVAHDIEVSKDDDVKIIAKQFVIDHGLEEDAIPALVAYIGEQLDAAREEEEEGEEEEQQALEELKQQQPPTDSKRPSRRPPPQPNSPGSSNTLSNLPPPPIPPAPTGMEDNISGNVDDDKEKGIWDANTATRLDHHHHLVSTTSPRGPHTSAGNTNI